VILKGRVGSHAYGLAHAESDEDFLGVFAAPTLDVAGLDWNAHSETVTNTSATNPMDTTLHEVGKFIRLVLKANPTVTELLWLDTSANEQAWTHKTIVGSWLLDHRALFLSEKYVRSAYRGYAFSQLQKFVSEERYKLKHARHCLRLIEQGRGALENGEVLVKVANAQVYWDLAEMTHEQTIETLKAGLDSFDEVHSTPLPELPDTESAAYLLRLVRRVYIDR
jgi:predicted nucleotidyltransferase